MSTMSTMSTMARVSKLVVASMMMLGMVPVAARALPVVEPAPVAADDAAAAVDDPARAPEITEPQAAELPPSIAEAPVLSADPVLPEPPAPDAAAPATPATTTTPSTIPAPSGSRATTAPAPAMAKAVAPASGANRLLDEAYAQLHRRDLEGARLTFAAAARAGAPAQRVDLELGYLSLATRDPERAHQHFGAARGGPDPVLADRAQAEAAALPRHFSADLYAEAFGWSRSRAGNPSDDLVSMVRARGLWRPRLLLDAHLYLFAQGTRDVASKGRGSAGVPEIYADNYAIAGAGAFLRLWQGRAALFAQAGGAVDLLDDGRERFALDARAGIFGGAESVGCASGGADGTASASRIAGWNWGLRSCAEAYGEATYVSRFDHNVIGFSRLRAGFAYLAAGPLSFQVLAEARVATDRNHDYYNNFADAGLVQRVRLAGQVPLSLVVGAHVGRYFGFEGRDPAPDRLSYVDARLIASTYVGF